jgi:hypothetical protein
LGAGHTHADGDFKREVKNGLQYLIGRMGAKGALDEPGGRMYAHGLATIALCEAYGMTRDKALLAPAQKAIDFITYAQDPVGGGWRYTPKQPGDTSVTGWQLMALKSGHRVYLLVPPKTVKGGIRFLDGVQAEGGAYYGYTGPGKRPATSAIGLLARMYLGWKRDDPRLDKGVKYLADTGPSASNMYHNYYATHVLFQQGGEPWEKWNATMRDMLVENQSKEKDAAGSWHFRRGDHGAQKGGRLYCTSLATLVLEVYYRYPNIYDLKKRRSTGGGEDD